MIESYYSKLFCLFLLHIFQRMKKNSFFTLTKIVSEQSAPRQKQPKGVSSKINHFAKESELHQLSLTPDKCQISQPIQEDRELGGEKWTAQQQAELWSLHNKWGNRWVEISLILNRSDNAIKNHYHSRLRRGLRYLNRFSKERLNGEFKEIHINIISKIIQGSDEMYVQEPQNPAQAAEAYALKNALLTCESQGVNGQVELVRTLMIRLLKFAKSYRKRCKYALQKCPGYSYKGKEIKTLIQDNHQQHLWYEQRLKASLALNKKNNLKNSKDSKKQIKIAKETDQVSVKFEDVNFQMKQEIMQNSQQKNVQFSGQKQQQNQYNEVPNQPFYPCFQRRLNVMNQNFQMPAQFFSPYYFIPTYMPQNYFFPPYEYLIYQNGFPLVKYENLEEVPQ